MVIQPAQRVCIRWCDSDGMLRDNLVKMWALNWGLRQEGATHVKTKGKSKKGLQAQNGSRRGPDLSQQQAVARWHTLGGRQAPVTGAGQARVKADYLGSDATGALNTGQWQNLVYIFKMWGEWQARQNRSRPLLDKLHSPACSTMATVCARRAEQSLQAEAEGQRGTNWDLGTGFHQSNAMNGTVTY